MLLDLHGVVNEFSKIYDQAEHFDKLVEPIVPRIAQRQSHM